MSSPSARAMSAMARSISVVVTGNSTGRLSNPSAPPAAPDAATMNLCARLRFCSRFSSQTGDRRIRRATRMAAMAAPSTILVTCSGAKFLAAFNLRPSILETRMARPTRSSRRTASISAAWSAGVIWVVSNSGVISSCSPSCARGRRSNMAALRRESRAAINLVRRRKLKSSAFRLIYALPRSRSAGARRSKLENGLAADCEQFESIPASNFYT